MLLTGTIISAKKTFKYNFKDKEKQAISIMILYTVLALFIALITVLINLIIIGKKFYKIYKIRNLKKNLKNNFKPISEESPQNFDLLTN